MAGDKKVVALQESLGAETEKFRAIQKDLNKCLGSAQQLEAQLKENEVVKEELGLVKEDSKVYKMIGPVLVKQVRDNVHWSLQKSVCFFTRLQQIANVHSLGSDWSTQ